MSAFCGHWPNRHLSLSVSYRSRSFRPFHSGSALGSNRCRNTVRSGSPCCNLPDILPGTPSGCFPGRYRYSRTRSCFHFRRCFLLLFRSRSHSRFRFRFHFRKLRLTGCFHFQILLSPDRSFRSSTIRSSNDIFYDFCTYNTYCYLFFFVLYYILCPGVQKCAFRASSLRKSRIVGTASARLHRLLLEFFLSIERSILLWILIRISAALATVIPSWSEAIPR